MHDVNVECWKSMLFYYFFFFNDTATTEIYTLSLHDALPIWRREGLMEHGNGASNGSATGEDFLRAENVIKRFGAVEVDRKSTRLNSSHANISYAVFCLKKKKNNNTTHSRFSIPSTSSHSLLL